MTQAAIQWHSILPVVLSGLALAVSTFALFTSRQALALTRLQLQPHGTAVLQMNADGDILGQVRVTTKGAESWLASSLRVAAPKGETFFVIDPDMQCVEPLAAMPLALPLSADQPFEVPFRLWETRLKVGDNATIVLALKRFSGKAQTLELLMHTRVEIQRTNSHPNYR